MQPALTALLHDLDLGGVRVEVGTGPATWSRQQMAGGGQQPAAPARLPEPSPKPKARNPQPAPTLPQAPQLEARVKGEPGGVAVVSATPLTEAERALLANMLAAVGLNAKPLALAHGHVGLAQAVASQQPSHVLVLGQAPLSNLLGKATGVEDWHRAPTPLLPGFAGAVGATYPLDLLLKNPLYKKRAWQHLLKWTS